MFKGKLKGRSRILGHGLLALASIGVFGTACSAESTDAGDASNSSVVEAKETLLAEIDVGYGVVSFRDVVSPNGTHMISLSEQAPSNLKSTPLDQLLANYGRLTPL